MRTSVGKTDASLMTRVAVVLVAASLAVLLVLRACDEAREWTPTFCSGSAHAGLGEALIHGLTLKSLSVSFSMPLYSVPNAMLCSLDSLPIRASVLGLTLLACVLLVVGLGRQLGSTGHGVVAAALFLAVPFPETILQDRWLHIPTVLLVALAMTWRANRPSRWRSVVLGAAVGTSVMVLSSLVLLLPILVAFEAVRDARRGTFSLRSWRLDAAALILVPLLLLLPWVYFNWHWSHRFLLLEDGRADLHLATGALGIVHTIPLGNGSRLAGVPTDQSVALWAIGEVLRHPVRYVFAVLERAWWVVSLNPVMALAGIAGLVRGVRHGNRCAAALAFLVAYWFSLHCVISTEKRYFLPFWPLLAAPAASLIPSWLRTERRGSADRMAAVILAGCFAPLLALQLYVDTRTVTFPSRAAEPGAFEREAKASPGCAWPLIMRGRELMSSGRAAEAIDDLTRALELQGTDRDPNLEVDLAWALTVGGGPWERIEPLLPTGGYLVGSELHLLRAFVALQRGGMEEAREELVLTASAHEEDVLSEPSLQDPAMRAHVLASCDSIAGRASRALQYWPLDRRVVLLARLGELTSGGRAGSFWAGLLPELAQKTVDAARQAGDREAEALALEVLSRAQAGSTAPGSP
jgi:hypothetical protein